MSDKVASAYALKKRAGCEVNHFRHDPKRPIPWCELCQRDEAQREAAEKAKEKERAERTASAERATETAS